MNDTREQLERSIDRFLGSWTGWSVSIKVLREAIIGWLDRQAAITEQQTERKWCCYEDSVQAEIDRLQRRNDELRTSYDKLKRERDNLAADLAECMEQLDKARDEREMYRECFSESVGKADEIRAIMARMELR